MKKFLHYAVSRKGYFFNVSIIMVMSFVIIIPVMGQTKLYGPETTPPKDYSITTSHPESSGQIGREDGMLYTITNITLSNTTTIYWTMLDSVVKLSMDGSVYDGLENMILNQVETDLSTGVVIWVGETVLPLADGSSESLLSKFIMTVVDISDSPLELIDPVSIGLPVETGGAVLITDNAMTFKVRMEMLVSDDGGVSYTPHLDYYDSASTPEHVESAYSTYNYGFYWENDPPKLTVNNEVNVDEGDTVSIDNTILMLTDVESEDADINIVFDPLAHALLPNFGKLMYNNVDMVLPDTIFLTDIIADSITYLHNGTESIADSIPFLVFDGDSALCKIDGDTIFYIKITITPVDDAPTVVINNGTTIDEEGEVVINETMLLTSDPESSADLVTYTLDPLTTSDFPKNGLLKLNGIPLSDGSTFTQADIAGGLLDYTHDGSETLNDGFVFRVVDEFGHYATVDENSDFFFEITINPVNDTPIFTKNIPLEVDEGGTVVIANSNIAASDPESGPEDISFTLDPDFNIDEPIHGTVFLDGTELGDGDSFTMDDVNNNIVTYQHDGGESTTDFIAFNISDPDGGIVQDGEYTVFQNNIHITPVNDPPTLENPIEDHSAKAGQEYNFIFAENTFLDVDVDDLLTYKALLSDESNLPDWLTFEGESRLFTGTPLSSDIGAVLNIVVVATDTELEEVTDVFDLEIINPVAINMSRAKEAIFDVYPNPFSNQLTVNIAALDNNLVHVQVINLLGEVIRDFQASPGSESVLDFQDEQSGIYFIRVFSEDRISRSMKVLKR